MEHIVKKIVIRKIVLAGIALWTAIPAFSQVIERERPAEWDNLVEGSRFVDRFLPMQGSVLSSDTWGAEGVKPRWIDNGIEDRVWSYWGGNIKKGEDGLYHLFVCGWLEISPRGHMEWPDSYVFHAVSDNLTGPFVLRNMIGRGHNPEVYQLKDGRWVLYVIDGRYVADDLNGRWEYGQFDFNARDRRIIEGLSNLSFARREDGSFVMVCRGGGIWISRDGLSEYSQLTDHRVYPDVKGEFEDPVIWRDHIQYHMIVNDWLGRIAFYLRSKDGINWVTDPGEAYLPGIAVHQDGLSEDWFKYERIKIYQDEHGRAIQANFAVIDTLKHLDGPSDNHSSKNIGIPLNPGLLISILDEKPITARTKTIRVKIEAEKGFDPKSDIDLTSLRFGGNEAVNYGGGSKVLRTEEAGDDLIVVFDGEGNGITSEEFAPKLIGKYSDGRMLFAYASLPYVEYIEPILSARAPVFEKEKGSYLVEVENFGQTASAETAITIEHFVNRKHITLASGKVPALQPYGKTSVGLKANKTHDGIDGGKLRITIRDGKKTLSTFEFDTNR